MIGAIIGDIVGSIYERNNHRSKDFQLFSYRCTFTDDTVLTVGVAEALMNEQDFRKHLHKWGRKYPRAGYGRNFKKWIKSDNPKPYGSYGNGSAMRVSPVGMVFDTMEETLRVAEESAVVSHNHPDGINGAKAVAGSIYLARTGGSKQDIQEFVETLGYPVDFELDELQRSYRFNSSCAGSVPQAIYCFLISEDFEDTLRTSVSIGGDTDTICAVSGAIAEGYHGIPEWIEEEAMSRLPQDMVDVIEDFRQFSKR